MKTLTLLMASMLLLVAGCATPDARIKKNPVAFDQATPAQQELIKQGKVGLGFDPTLVKLAVGDPDRIWERTDKDGKSTVWAYVTYETSGGAMLYRGWYHRWWGPQYYAFYSDCGDRREYEQLRVVFKDGRVVSVEEVK